MQLPHREPESHKGENGKVGIIGGSREQHGAPLMTALAAEASGADLLHVCVPACHEEVAKSMSLNFQVHPFVGNDLSRQDTDGILELLSLMDSAVIGPGIARTKASLEAQQRVIVGATCPLVLDASALQPTIPAAIRGKQCVLTPHRGELERLGIPLAQVGNKAREWGVVILLKGPSDHVFTPDGTQTEVRGGNAGLTVGGTGDALAGLIAGFLAQRLAPLDACVLASTLIKQAGEFLSKDHGYTYTTHQVIKQIPLLLTRQRG